MPSSLFHRACESGDIEVAKQELLKEKKLKLDIIGSAFSRACFEGQLELAKWILELSPNKSATISADMYEPLLAACRNKQLEVAEWLVSLKPFLFEVKQLPTGKLKAIVKNDHLAFRHACLTGNLEAAQWILTQKPRMAISRMELEEIFGVACLKGNLEVAQWLLQVKPKIDIHADRDFALKSATKNGHTEVVSWLTEIKA
jgi:ankyrin repeat protein